MAALLTWSSVPNSLLLVFGQIAILSITLILWSLNVGPGEIAGILALLTLVSGRLVPASIRITSAITALANTLPWVEGLNATRDSLLAEAREAPADVVDGWMPWQSVALDTIGYTYPGTAAPALSEIDMTIERGRAYGLVGPSGAGKTTLADVLLGLLPPSKGTLRLDGTALDAPALSAWRRRLGYVPQAAYIADATLRSNVAFGIDPGAVDDARVRECVELAALGEFVAALPAGLDTALGDRGTRLSGGQRQRIAIARALYNRPELLVLDEATSALDTLAETNVKDAIERLRGRTTTVTIAHRLSTVRGCDTIFVMDRGRIVDSGTWDELITRSSLFREMVEAGTGKEAA